MSLGVLAVAVDALADVVRQTGIEPWTIDELRIGKPDYAGGSWVVAWETWGLVYSGDLGSRP